MPPTAKPVALRCPSAPSNDGALSLSWSVGGGGGGGNAHGHGSTFVVRENGVVLYRGSDTATSVSGRHAGSYRYRVGVVGADGAVRQWSNTCAVEVQPPSMRMAMGFFGVGLFVFAATVVLVLVGHRRHRRQLLRTQRDGRPPSAVEDDA